MDLKDFIRSIPDYPKKGILFRDITTLIKDEKAFKATIDQIIERSKNFKIDKIAAIESRGFVFASAVSYLLKKPFIMLRKKNKLPADVHSVDFELEYGTATIEVHKDSFKENDSVLVIDDLIATGGTADAAAKLIEMSNANVAAFIFVINLFDLGGCDNLRTKNYKIDKIAAIESRGFVFASAVSYLLKKPFIMLRKKNKLPADVHSVDFELEYGTATIEVHKDSFKENDSVLIIDDLIATGGTADAAAKLIEMSNAKVAAFIFVINLFDLGGCDNLRKKNYQVENLIEFPGH